ncbi:reticulocyte-binding protein homolog 2a-like [Saccostrea echinata]|uniref:reticulocyte-binding protein homolog 2a-like n=1 Tax=Saccostrea echinata TaxID=191078 RepID=UPI002A810C99|nr:reticulocyte-binding protein homolog 2a-like [Saccostrea echinata]
MPMDVDNRRVREQTLLLIEQRRKHNKISLKKSGVDEEYGEKENLMDEALELFNEEEQKKKTLKTKAEKEETIGKDIRKRAPENLTPTKSEEDLRKMPRKSSVVTYLKEKTEAEIATKQEELALKKEELKLERDRFELERQERVQRLENEKQHNKMMMELLAKCLNK